MYLKINNNNVYFSKNDDEDSMLQPHESLFVKLRKIKTLQATGFGCNAGLARQNCLVNASPPVLAGRTIWSTQ